MLRHKDDAGLLKKWKRIAYSIAPIDSISYFLDMISDFMRKKNTVLGKNSLRDDLLTLWHVGLYLIAGDELSLNKLIEQGEGYLSIPLYPMEVQTLHPLSRDTVGSYLLRVLVERKNSEKIVSLLNKKVEPPIDVILPKGMRSSGEKARIEQKKIENQLKEIRALELEKQRSEDSLKRENKVASNSSLQIDHLMIRLRKAKFLNLYSLLDNFDVITYTKAKHCIREQLRLQLKSYQWGCFSMLTRRDKDFYRYLNNLCEREPFDLPQLILEINTLLYVKDSFNKSSRLLDSLLDLWHVAIYLFATLESYQIWTSFINANHILLRFIYPSKMRTEHPWSQETIGSYLLRIAVENDDKTQIDFLLEKGVEPASDVLLPQGTYSKKQKARQESALHQTRREEKNKKLVFNKNQQKKVTEQRAQERIQENAREQVSVSNFTYSKIHVNEQTESTYISNEAKKQRERENALKYQEEQEKKRRQAIQSAEASFTEQGKESGRSWAEERIKIKNATAKKEKESLLDNRSKSVISTRVGWFGSEVREEKCGENHPLSASAVPPSGGGGNSSSGESSDEGSVVSLGDNRESLFRRNNSGGRKPKRFEQLAFNLTKAEFRILLNEGKIPVTEKQMRTIKQDILTSGAMTSISLKKMSNGNIHMSCERPGHTSGFQRMSFTALP